MKVYSRIFVMLMLITAVLLVACGGEEEPTAVPPTEVPPTAVPTEVPPTAVPTEVPPTEVPPTEVPPTAVPEPDMALTTHESDAGGYTVDYPEDWFVNDLFGMGMFTSSEIAMDEMEDMSTLDSAVVIMMGGAMADVEGDDPFEMLDQATGEFEMEEGMEIVDGPTAITVNGSDGATLSVRGDADGTQIYATIATLTNGVNTVVVMAVAPAADEETYAPAFDAMINSIEISEDEITDPFGDAELPAIDAVNAGSLNMGEAIAGLILENAAMSWTFDGAAGTTYNLVVTPTDDNLDVVVDVLDETGVSILPYGEVDDAFDEETVSFDAPADGTYTVVLHGFADSNGAYTLILTGAGESSGAVGGDVTYTETIEGVIADDETVTHEFDGVAGTIINVVVSPTDDDLDAVVDIVDADGNSIIGGEVDEEFDTEEILGVVIPADGTYYVSVRGFAGGSGPYELTYSEMGTSTGDTGSDNSGGAAGTGEITTGIVPDNESVTWEFSGNANDVVSLVVTPTDDDLDAVVDVLDADGYSIIGGEVDEAFDAEEISNIVLPADGTYSVVIRGFAGTGGGYELIFNGADSGAGVPAGEGGGSISYGEFASGEVTAAGGNVWTFNGSQGDFVDVTVVPYDGLDVVIDLVDSDGNSMLFDGAVDESFDTEFVRVVPIPADGQYAVVVTAYSDGETGSYELYLGETLSEQAGSIVFVYNAFTEPDEEGFTYPFTAAAGEYVTLYVNPEAELDVVLGVYNEETDELIEEVDDYTGQEELIFYAEELDNYYFLVTAFDGGVGGFDLTLSGSENIISEIFVDDGIVGRVVDGEVLSYGYYGEAGTTVSFVIESDENMDMVINLEDLDGNILVDMDDGLSGEGEVLTYTFEESLYIFVNVSEFFGDVGQFALYVE